MSQSDKTRQKLVDSMRKTKSGAAAKSDAIAVSEPDKAAAAKKATASRTKPAAQPRVKKSATDTPVDAYQSVRRRVWPD